jgi:hypothetical protein
MTTVKLLRSATAGNIPSSLVAGQIAINEADGLLFYRDPAGAVASVPIRRDQFILGYELATDITDPTNDINIGPGACADMQDVIPSSNFGLHVTSKGWLKLASPLIKRLDAAWAVGNNQGGLDGGTVESTRSYHVHAIKRPDTGVVDALFSLAHGGAMPCTITIASPGVVTATDHGIGPDTPIKFSTTGALPTGLTAGTQYFVKTFNDENSFTVSATRGGTAINTSGSQSGTHTVYMTPIMPTNYTLRRRIGSLYRNASNANRKFWMRGDGFVHYMDCDTVGPEISLNATQTVTATALNVPYGICVRPLVTCFTTSSAAGQVTAQIFDNYINPTNGGSETLGYCNLAGQYDRRSVFLVGRTSRHCTMPLSLAKDASQTISLNVQSYGYFDFRGTTGDW